ncbi:hypothetical protein P7F60_00835 [Rhizobium sp. YJ-22]|uniref:hypothetical protein n=1 Tax=Rhizobium sp. YJ-22 TaxID=3037556 RepID=UPI002412BAA1|nr:hypothetical protein [Rhizobium sp. YJ-22]MDG3574916.1 hypothetical protein [Rhizobium sp. YJ-22]
MFKFLWRRRFVRNTDDTGGDKALWQCDSLGHRQLAAMSLRELADLPPDVLRDLCVTPLSRCKLPLPAPRAPCRRT